MVKVLRNLRVDEISAVDAGAVEGVRIVLHKRADDSDSAGVFKRIFGVSETPYRPVLKDDDAVARLRRQLAYGKARGNDDDDAPRSRVDRDHYMPWLANDERDGRRDYIDSMLTRELAGDTALHPRMRAALTGRTRPTRKEDTMNATQLEALATRKLEGIAKRYGPVAIAKHIIAQQGASGIGEHEFAKIVTDSVPRRSGESGAQAFSRALCANDEGGLALRKAFDVIKTAAFVARSKGAMSESRSAFGVDPGQHGAEDTSTFGTDPDQHGRQDTLEAVGGRFASVMDQYDDMTQDLDEDYAGEETAKRHGAAYAALMAKARALAKRTGMSEAQCFAKIYTDPKYAVLAAAERRANRPA